MVAVCKTRDVCCLPAPAHQPFSSNSLDLSSPEEALIAETYVHRAL